jgi:hypothetical protein
MPPLLSVWFGFQFQSLLSGGYRDFFKEEPPVAAAGLLLLLFQS